MKDDEVFRHPEEAFGAITSFTLMLHSEARVSPRSFSRANGIHQSPERPAQRFRELCGKAFVQWDRPNQLLYISNILGAVKVVKSSQQLNGDKIRQTDDPNSIND